MKYPAEVWKQRVRMEANQKAVPYRVTLQFDRRTGFFNLYGTPKQLMALRFSSPTLKRGTYNSERD